MAKVMVIGMGNPLRQDDGVGYRAALELQDRGFPAIAVLQPLPELALELARSNTVLFLDADVSFRAGQIRLRPLEDPEVRKRTEPPSTAMMPEHKAEPFTHNLGVEGLLKLTQTLTGRSPNAYALSLGVADIGHGEGFSPQVLAAYDKYLSCALAFLEPHARTEPCLEPAGPR